MKKKVFLVSAVIAALFVGICAACSPKETESGLSLSQTELSMDVGESARLELSGDGMIVLEGITWSSSSASVAAVENGTVEALGAGEAVITAQYSGESYTCHVTVEEVLTAALSQTELYLPEGDSAALELLAGGTALNGAQWSSSDDTVASVTDGMITAKTAGEAVISAEYEGETYACDLTVCLSPAGSYYADITVPEMENAYFEFDLELRADKTYTYSRRDCASTMDGPMEGGVVNSGSWQFEDERTIVFSYEGGEMRMRVRTNGALASVGELPTGGMDAELTFQLTEKEE